MYPLSFSLVFVHYRPVFLRLIFAAIQFGIKDYSHDPFCSLLTVLRAACLPLPCIQLPICEEATRWIVSRDPVLGRDSLLEDPALHSVVHKEAGTALASRPNTKERSGTKEALVLLDTFIFSYKIYLTQSRLTRGTSSTEFCVATSVSFSYFCCPSLYYSCILYSSVMEYGSAEDYRISSPCCISIALQSLS